MDKETEVVTQATPEVEVKKFEQADVDKIVNERLAREKSKWSKDLGIGEEFSKEEYVKFKEHLNSQKTEAEKLKEELQTYKTKYNGLEGQIKQSKIENGVNTILAEFNVDSKHSNTILKLADLTGVYDNDLDTSKLKEAIQKTLENDLPMLLTKERIKIGGEKGEEKKLDLGNNAFLDAYSKMKKK